MPRMMTVGCRIFAAPVAWSASWTRGRPRAGGRSPRARRAWESAQRTRRRPHRSRARSAALTAGCPIRSRPVRPGPYRPGMSIEARWARSGSWWPTWPKALAFYRRLGVQVPADADAEPHVEVTLAGGLRLAFDTEETIRSFHPDWQPPAGGGRIALAFALPDAAAVDAAVRRADRRGAPRRAGAVRRVLGTALRRGARSGRQRRGPVRPARQLSRRAPRRAARTSRERCGWSA